MGMKSKSNICRWCSDFIFDMHLITYLFWIYLSSDNFSLVNVDTSLLLQACVLPPVMCDYFFFLLAVFNIQFLN